MKVDQFIMKGHVAMSAYEICRLLSQSSPTSADPRVPRGRVQHAALLAHKDFRWISPPKSDITQIIVCSEVIYVAGATI